MRLRLLLATIALFFVSTPVMAQTLSAQEISRRFSAFDTDNDGRISKEEFELNKVVAIFDPHQERSRSTTTASGAPGRIDRDIGITRDAARVNAQSFAAMDANGDGTLSGGEIIASELMQFESLDRNGDGFIDRAEFDAMIDRLFR
jgi:Ca2+-binding EF-hand superfamily protein